MKIKLLIFYLISVGLIAQENQIDKKTEKSLNKKNITPILKPSIIIDTDANNEVDDQHALAYLFFNSDFFDIRGVTINATANGGNIQQHYDEAKRVIQLCGGRNKIPILKGALGNFSIIKKSINNSNFDGSGAVNFIIKEASKFSQENKLIVLAVGKLTNIALAIKKEPLITPNIRLVWLGSNYPEPGEYNLINDIDSMNFLLNTQINFEIVTVRYGKITGTDFVNVDKKEVELNFPSLGIEIDTPVIGRHGGKFYKFGHYSKSLFDNISFRGNPPTRALFDMAAVAILKNPSWAKSFEIPNPIMVDEKWVDRPKNNNKLKVWENFERKLILDDFYDCLTIDN